MPTYTYKCPSCGHAYQKIQRMADNSRAKCPECGARGERVITGGGGLIFKGSGFYATDYKHTARQGGDGAEKGDAAKPAEEGSKTPKDSPKQAESKKEDKS